MEQETATVDPFYSRPWQFIALGSVIVVSVFPISRVFALVVVTDPERFVVWDFMILAGGAFLAILGWIGLALERTAAFGSLIGCCFILAGLLTLVNVEPSASWRAALVTWAVTLIADGIPIVLIGLIRISMKAYSFFVSGSSRTT